jgi:hypothetical protein
MTLAYLNDNEECLEQGAAILRILEDHHESSEDKMAALLALEPEYDDEVLLNFFDGQNLVRYLVEAKANGGTAVSEMPKLLLERFLIFNVIDEDSEIMRSRIERATEEAYNELYPLYCKPSEDTIRYFIENCPEIAFMEVGEGDYFAYLTSSGMSFAPQIAYAYLKVDDCIPDNILDERSDLSTTPDFIANEIREFLES